MSATSRLNTCKSSCPSSVNCTLSGWYLFEYIIFCMVIWWITYLLVWILSRQTEEWTCRLLTFFHGTIVSYRALKDVTVNWNRMNFRNMPLSDEQKGYLSFMLSYFIFDFIWIQVFGDESWVIYFHHISSILVITKVMISNFGGLGVAFGVAGLEMTNPYLQMRWFLRTYGYLNKPIHMAVELWFFLLFIIIRVLGGSLLFYHIQVHADVDGILKILVTCIYFVSIALSWDISRYFKKKYWDTGKIVSILPVHGNNRDVNQVTQNENEQEDQGHDEGEE